MNNLASANSAFLSKINFGTNRVSSRFSHVLEGIGNKNAFRLIRIAQVCNHQSKKQGSSMGTFRSTWRESSRKTCFPHSWFGLSTFSWRACDLFWAEVFLGTLTLTETTMYPTQAASCFFYAGWKSYWNRNRLISTHNQVFFLHDWVELLISSEADPGFWSGGPAEFWPWKLSPEPKITQNYSKQGLSP